MGACQLSQGRFILHHSWWITSSFSPVTSLSVYLRSYLVNTICLPLTFHKGECELWGWSRCVSLVETHRLACKMTYLGHQVALTWDQLLTLTRSPWLCFDASQPAAHCRMNYSRAFLVGKLEGKQTILTPWPTDPKVLLLAQNNSNQIRICSITIHSFLFSFLLAGILLKFEGRFWKFPEKWPKLTFHSL